jgi:hypothetical protein
MDLKKEKNPQQSIHNAPERQSKNRFRHFGKFTKNKKQK